MRVPSVQVLTMVLPLLLIMVLPKMMNAADPETRKVSVCCIISSCASSIEKLIELCGDV